MPDEKSVAEHTAEVVKTIRDSLSPEDVDMSAYPPQSGAGPAKHDAGKIRPTLVPPEAINAIAYLMTWAIERTDPPPYAEESWRTLKPQRVQDALRRHMLLQQLGETHDKGSGKPHSWHIATNAAILVALLDEPETQP